MNNKPQTHQELLYQRKKDLAASLLEAANKRPGKPAASNARNDKGKPDLTTAEGVARSFGWNEDLVAHATNMPLMQQETEDGE